MQLSLHVLQKPEHLNQVWVGSCFFALKPPRSPHFYMQSQCPYRTWPTAISVSSTLSTVSFGHSVNHTGRFIVTDHLLCLAFLSADTHHGLLIYLNSFSNITFKEFPSERVMTLQSCLLCYTVIINIIKNLQFSKIHI